MYISVCIPTFNGALFIREQLQSILSQLTANDEIIISDDRSTDDTLKIIDDFHDPRIILFVNNGIKGPVPNVENALNQAAGEYIFLADQDDIWYPEKIAVMLPLLEKYDLVLSDATIIDQSGNLTGHSFFKANKSGRGLFKNLYRNSFNGCCMAFNRKLLSYVLPFPKGIAMHDMWIGLNAALMADYYLLPRQLVYYRRHGGNATPGSERSGFSIQYMIRYRVYMIFHVLVRRLQHAFGIRQRKKNEKTFRQ